MSALVRKYHHYSSCPLLLLDVFGVHDDMAEDNKLQAKSALSDAFKLRNMICEVVKYVSTEPCLVA